MRLVNEQVTWYESTTANSELSPVSYVTEFELLVVFNLNQIIILEMVMLLEKETLSPILNETTSVEQIGDDDDAGVCEDVDHHVLKIMFTCRRRHIVRQVEQ